MSDLAIEQLAGEGANFDTVSVAPPSGDIASRVMWVDADDQHVAFDTEVHRARFRALSADPRTTVTIRRADDPSAYADVRGRVVDTITARAARDHIDALARRATGADDANEVTSERVIVKVAPERRRHRNP